MMKVVYHEDYNQLYTSDPAAAPGRIQAVVAALHGKVTWVKPEPASELDILQCHTPEHIKSVDWEKVYDIAALAAGGAIMAAEIGLTEPCFALIRPPGHHASRDCSWGFCYFNNMAIAIDKLYRQDKIKKAFILDFDLHFGDGTVDILGTRSYITIRNPSGHKRADYLKEVEKALAETDADLIAASAGFDNAEKDWGGLLKAEDYTTMGRWMREAAQRNQGGCFGILEGGYNHAVLGQNVLAFIEGLGGK